MTDPAQQKQHTVNEETLAADASLDTNAAGEFADTDAALSRNEAQFSNVGRYKIVKKLGEGAMGSVYLADDPTLQRQIALKIPIINGETARERFFREARAAAKLRHANICPVFDVGEVDGQLFIAMAFIEGNDLQSLLAKGRIKSRRAAANLCRKLADAMQHAHAENVAHRDLKPANIMLDARHDPLIMDFGLAQETNEDTRMTQTGTLMGSPSYMSPEQVRAKPNEIGPATDIYSLGVILYEMLTGKLPFRGSLGELMMKILTKEPTSPRDIEPSIDARIESICLRMMAKDVEQRYASMAEVRNDLKRYLLDLQKQPGPKSSARTTNVAMETTSGGADLEKLNTDSNFVDDAAAAAENAPETSLLTPASNEFTELDDLGATSLGDLSDLGALDPALSAASPLSMPSLPKRAASTSEKKEPTPWYLNVKLMIGAGFGILLVCSLGLAALWQLVSQNNEDPPAPIPQGTQTISPLTDAPQTSKPTVIDGPDATLNAVE